MYEIIITGQAATTVFPIESRILLHCVTHIFYILGTIFRSDANRILPVFSYCDVNRL